MRNTGTNRTDIEAILRSVLQDRTQSSYNERDLIVQVRTSKLQKVVSCSVLTRCRWSSQTFISMLCETHLELLSEWRASRTSEERETDEKSPREYRVLHPKQYEASPALRRLIATFQTSDARLLGRNFASEQLAKGHEDLNGSNAVPPLVLQTERRLGKGAASARVTHRPPKAPGRTDLSDKTASSVASIVPTLVLADEVPREGRPRAFVEACMRTREATNLVSPDQSAQFQELLLAQVLQILQSLGDTAPSQVRGFSSLPARYRRERYTHDLQSHAYSCHRRVQRTCRTRRQRRVRHSVRQ